MTNGIHEIGPCRAEADVGHGGSGVVRDSPCARLDRSAAIKLPPSRDESRPIQVVLDRRQILVGECSGRSSP